MAIDQKILNPELVAWLEARQARLKIVKTTKTPSGQTLDWIPVESQDPAGRIASPPPAISANHEPVDKLRPTKPLHFELTNPKVERGPAGTVPLVRPDISRLTRTIPLKDFLRKPPGGRRGQPSPPKEPPGISNQLNYFHAQSLGTATVFGCEFIMNVWAPAIGLPVPVPGDDHSILQTWLLDSPKPIKETVEGGWTVDLQLNGDVLPHVFTYFTTNGYAKDGDNLGGYNSLNAGWHQVALFPFPGALLTPNSQIGGEQFDIAMKFQLFREPDGQLNWWVGLGGVWMGYYPTSLFKGELTTGAKVVSFGGEVLTSLADPILTQDQMGSGSQAAVGWTQAAYMRNLRDQTDLKGTMVSHNGTIETETPPGVKTTPYTIAGFPDKGEIWGSHLFLGGPAAGDPKTFLFDQINFTIVTGDDDLRDDSTATAVVDIAGIPQLFTLKKAGESGWANGSTHVLTFQIGGVARHRSAFGATTITLTSHDSFPETQDNWNIQSLAIALSGASGVACLHNQQGNPLARLTGSAPSVTLAPGGC